MNQIEGVSVGAIAMALGFLFLFAITKRRRDRKRNDELLDQWIFGLLEGRTGDEEIHLFSPPFSLSVYDLFSQGLGAYDFEGRPILWRSGDGSTHLSFLVEGGGMATRFSVKGDYRLTLQPTLDQEPPAGSEPIEEGTV